MKNKELRKVIHDGEVWILVERKEILMYFTNYNDWFIITDNKNNFTAVLNDPRLNREYRCAAYPITNSLKIRMIDIIQTEIDLATADGDSIKSINNLILSQSSIRELYHNPIINIDIVQMNIAAYNSLVFLKIFSKNNSNCPLAYVFIETP